MRATGTWLLMDWPMNYRDSPLTSSSHSIASLKITKNIAAAQMMYIVSCMSTYT